MRSGSKKPRTAPTSDAAPAPELSEWQVRFLEDLARTKLASELRFGGGAALAAVFLHHRRSEDLDFFSMREVASAELRPVVKRLTRAGIEAQVNTLGVRQSLVLLRDGRPFGRVDFAYYPYDPIERASKWRGFAIESLLDMTVNKVQAVLTRFQPRDYVDLFFLLQEGPERDLDRLLGLVGAKFDVGADRLALAQRFLKASQIAELPEMIRPVDLPHLVAFFEERARELTRS